MPRKLPPHRIDVRQFPVKRCVAAQRSLPATGVRLLSPPAGSAASRPTRRQILELLAAGEQTVGSVVAALQARAPICRIA
jgi:hypothetical protein